MNEQPTLCRARVWSNGDMEPCHATMPCPQHSPTSYQGRVWEWMQHTFGQDVAASPKERFHRFLEEALELVQALGCTEREALQLVDYVFGRPKGEPAQEVGGTMVTLAGLCQVAGVNMTHAGNEELQRIWCNVEKIRAKQKTKPASSPLPGGSS